MIQAIPNFTLMGIGRKKYIYYSIGLKKDEDLGRMIHSGINGVCSVFCHLEMAKHSLPIDEKHVGINPSQRKCSCPFFSPLAALRQGGISLT